MLLSTNASDRFILSFWTSHTYVNENFKTIQRWFKNNRYDLINCSDSQKNKYEEAKKQKIEEIKRDENISNYRKEILIGQWEANTMLYNVHYKDGMIVLIKKDIRKYFSEMVMILDNRGITLMTEKIEEKYNTFIHFIYRPAKPQEAESFWEHTENILRKKGCGKK